MTTLTISLPEKLKEFIDQRVESEGFGTVSEYLRSLVREDQKRRAKARLEALLLEGLESEASEMTAADWKRIRDEVHRRHEEREKSMAR
jgi:antitoxin ParD1/3/4